MTVSTVIVCELQQNKLKSCKLIVVSGPILIKPLVQLYDKTPAIFDGHLQCGDEIVAINGANVKGIRFIKNHQS